MTEKKNIDPSLTTILAEQIAEQNGFAPTDPEFCLYEATDTEALEAFFERTPGPLTTQFQVAGTTVTVQKTDAGEISVNVDPRPER